MHKILALTKVFLKTSFQNTMNAGESKNKSKGMWVMMLLAFAYLAGILAFMSYGMISALIPLQQEQAFIGVILLAIAMFVLIQTIFSSINILYFSSDNEYILPLPIKPRDIVIAKTNVMLITEYIIVIFIGFIPLCIYGIQTGANIVFYIMTVLVCAIFPILPMLISGIISMIIMSFSKFMKNKNRYQLIATIVSIVLALAIVFLSSNQQEVTDEQLAQFIMQANSLVDMFKGYFPTLGASIMALDVESIGTAILGLVQLIAITAVAYILYMVIAQKLYFKGAVGNLESGNKANKKFNERKAFKGGKLWKSYVGKEWKTLYRNPIFLMQCIVPTILIPIVFLGLFASQILALPQAELQQMTQELSGVNANMIVFIILGIIQFIFMFGYIAPTAISRDGQNATFMKYIPVPLAKQVIYKVLPSILLQIIIAIMVMALVWYVLQTNIVILLFTAIVAVIMIIMQNLLMIMVDLKKPKLEWSSEYAVVKQNMNLIWPMIIAMVSIVIYITLGMVISKVNIPVYIVLLALAIIYIIPTMVIKRYMQNHENTLGKHIY